MQRLVFLVLLSCVLASSSPTGQQSVKQELKRDKHHDFHADRPKTKEIDEQEYNPEYWRITGKQEVIDALQAMNNLNTNAAKNVIIFIGDGMSVPTITAARILKGQKEGRNGEEGKLVFENFPHIGLSKTYNVDSQTSDSAGTATAFMTGVKTNIGVVGVDARVTLGDCTAAMNEEYYTPSLMVTAQQAGRATGIVSTARITHATPASTYAHTSDRDFESTTSDEENCRNIPDIALQLIYRSAGENMKVVLGGGLEMFTPEGREDNRDLISEWIAREQDNGVFVRTRDELLAVDSSKKILGLFNDGHMSFEMDRTPESTEPTLTDMTAKAIELLENPNGFVLQVESGRIDHSHHEGMQRYALEETLEFERAIETALSMTNPEETLIIVTADHSHTMTFGGYPYRGSDMLGLTGENAGDDLPFTTLAYGNGPGYDTAFEVVDGQVKRRTLTEEIVADPRYTAAAPVPRYSETHGGDDVAIYAQGPFAHLFHSVHEQHVIYHVMAYAGCLSEESVGEQRCQTI